MNRTAYLVAIAGTFAMACGRSVQPTRPTTSESAVVHSYAGAEGNNSNGRGQLLRCIVSRHNGLIVNVLQPKVGEAIEYCWMKYDPKFERAEGIYAIFKSEREVVLYAIDGQKGSFRFANYGCFGLDNSPRKDAASDSCESSGGVWTRNRFENIIKLALKEGQWGKISWQASTETQIQAFEPACP